MAKSLLKTKIEELFKVKRSTIEFVIEDNSESKEFSIIVNTDCLLNLQSVENTFCCGIMDLGDTVIDLDLSNLDTQVRNSLLVDCMNQIYKMVKSSDIKAGIITYSNTSDNYITQALESDFNTIDSPWKKVSEFKNPNSGNTVSYFIAKLVE